jgi:hypothetical protein
VLGLVLEAKRAKAQVLAFVRDAAGKVSRDEIPKDATSLRAWLARADEVLPPLVGAAW